MKTPLTLQKSSQLSNIKPRKIDEFLQKKINENYKLLFEAKRERNRKTIKKVLEKNKILNQTSQTPLPAQFQIMQQAF